MLEDRQRDRGNTQNKTESAINLDQKTSPSLFVAIATLHLTFAMLLLLQEREI
jgi:hypothetical protein